MDRQRRIQRRQVDSGGTATALFEPESASLLPAPTPVQLAPIVEPVPEAAAPAETAQARAPAPRGLRHDLGRIALSAAEPATPPLAPPAAPPAAPPDGPLALQLRVEDPWPVQRDGPLALPTPRLLEPPGGAGPRPALLDPSLHLQLDPRLEALAQGYFQQRLDLASLLAGLSKVRLGQLPPPPPGQPAPGPTTPGPTAPGPTTPGSTAPAVDTKPGEPAPPPAVTFPGGPRAGTSDDIMDALLAAPEVAKVLGTLQTQATDRLRSDWGRLRTGEKVAAVSTVATIGLGALGGALANPESRRWVLGKLNGQVLPVPGVDWLNVEVNTSADNLLLGVHVDVGKLLPPSWGFGASPFSPTALGEPPIQRRADVGRPVDGEDLGSRIQSAALGPAGPIPGGVRQGLEATLGANLSGVRVHTGGEADHLAQSVNAVAFTTGPDIFFRSGAYNPSSSDGLRLLAHEAVHTVQQASGPVAGTPTAAGVAVSHPDDSFERAAADVADQVADFSAAAGTSGGPASGTAGAPAVQASAAGAGRGNQVSGANAGPAVPTSSADPAPAAGGAPALAPAVQREGDDKADDGILSKVTKLAGGAAETLVRTVSPGLADLIARGPGPVIQQALETALQAGLPALFGTVGLGSPVAAVTGAYGQAIGAFSGVVAGGGDACAGFAKMLGGIVDFVRAIIDNPITQAFKSGLSAVTSVFTKVVTAIAAPTFDLIRDVLGGAYDAVVSLGKTISGWVKTVKSAASSAWDWVAEKLGLPSDDEGGITGWVKAKAAEAWAKIKETFAPVIGPLKKVLSVVEVFTPMGQIHLLVTEGPKVVKAIGWLWENWGSPDLVKSAQNDREMSQTILPRVLAGARDFKGTLNNAVEWLLAQLTSLGSGLLELVGGLTGIPLLSFAQGLVKDVNQAITDLATFVQSELRQGVTWVQEAAENIWKVVEPYKEVLSSLALAAVNPTMIPVILAGWAWRGLPSCIKQPIIDFLLDIAITLAESIPQLPIFGPLWMILKPGAIAFLKTLRGMDPSVKEKAADKLAKIVSGASPEFLIGFVKGFLVGVWEGISDPFKAIWLVLEGLDYVNQYLGKLAAEALGLAPTRAQGEGGAAAAPAPAAAVAAPTAAGPMPAAASAAAPAGVGPVPAAAPAPTGAGPMPAATAAQGGVGPVPGGAPAPELGTLVMEEAAKLQPSFSVVTGQFWDAVKEYFGSGSGMGFADLTAKLGEAWDKMEAIVAREGKQLAYDAMAYFMSDKAEGEIGYATGWLAGTISFQVLLDIITAGTWIEVGPVVKAIAKFLNWPMEVLGEAFKILGKVGKFLVEGVKDLGRLVGEVAGPALMAVKDALKVIGTELVEFAERILGRFGGGALKEGENLALKEGQKLAGGEGAKLLGKEGENLAEKEGAKALEGQGEKALGKEGENLGEKEGQKAAEEGGEKAEQKSAEEEAKEAAEKPVAAAEARLIVAGMEVKGAPIPAVIAALDALKVQFRWIQQFISKPTGPSTNAIYMIGSSTLITPAYVAAPTLPSGEIDFVEWKKRLQSKGVTGDLDAIIARAQKGGVDGKAAIGELESFERAADRGFANVDVREPPKGPGAPSGVKSPEGTATLGGDAVSLEVKTGTVPPKRSTVNGQIDKANEQIAAKGLPGEIFVDLSKTDVKLGKGLTNQAEIEAFLNGKMTNDRLRNVNYLEIRWVGPDGKLKATYRTRTGGVVGPVTTVDIG